MRNARTLRIAAWTTTLMVAAGLAIAAIGATGAWFSDTHAGAINGTIGSIRVTPSGGIDNTGMSFSFENMLPGTPQTVTQHFQNTGNNPEDVYLVFPNATALSALNNLGHYGEVHVMAGGVALFDSANLNDRVSSCGPLSPSGCWPLPAQIKVASNLGPTASGSVAFTFNYSGELKTQPAAGTTAQFNVYPAPGTPTDHQTTIDPADGTGAGLPYQIVATQVGQTP